MLTCAAAILILTQSKAKPFDPVGEWRPRLTLVEAKIEKGTPDSVKQMMRDSVKEQNDKPEILTFAKDHTYRLPREQGTWKVDGRKLLLVVSKRGTMRVNGERRSYDIAVDGKSLAGNVNELIRVQYLRK